MNLHACLIQVDAGLMTDLTAIVVYLVVIVVLALFVVREHERSRKPLLVELDSARQHRASPRMVRGCDGEARAALVPIHY